MLDLTFEELVAVAQKLQPEQKLILINKLQPTHTQVKSLREILLMKLKMLQRVDTFNHMNNLRNKYASPIFDELTDLQLSATIREATNEWAKELDDYEN